MRYLFLFGALLTCSPLVLLSNLSAQEPKIEDIAEHSEPIVVPTSEVQNKMDQLWTQHCAEQQQDELRQQEMTKRAVQKDSFTMRYALSQKESVPKRGILYSLRSMVEVVLPPM